MKKYAPTRDAQVRDALLKKVIAEHVVLQSSLVIEELGLEHGACRVDVAVVNNSIHGYELKSDSDNLDRLPFQIATYSRSLDKATLVVAEKHLKKSVDLLPDWWGIKVVTTGSRGAVNISTVRPVSYNSSISPFHLAHLLWRPEVEDILRAKGLPEKLLRTNKAGLYKLLVETSKLSELRKYVRDSLKCRTKWRSQTQLASGDDYSLQSAM
ncbi:sce7726 family protein [Pseudomonas oryzihabitans]|uniref:sce7726 family protein n=1 Tax=Pseudomonas oryzihabitans TaxID=47885 RepID=UPI00119EAD91